MFSFCVGVCVVGGGEEGIAINNVNVQWNKMQAVLITADGDKNKKAKKDCVFLYTQYIYIQ